MNIAAFNILSQSLRNQESIDAVREHYFCKTSAYQAELNHFGKVTGTVKKMTKRLLAKYETSLQVAKASQSSVKWDFECEVSIDALDDLEVSVRLNKGEIDQLIAVDSGKDLSDLLDITNIYFDIVRKVSASIDESGENVKFNDFEPLEEKENFSYID